MLHLDGNVDIYNIECNKLLKYNIIAHNYQLHTLRDCLHECVCVCVCV
jgi:hypothetical protein